ncbi:MAG: putative porin [Myxococcota bacterium]
MRRRQTGVCALWVAAALLAAGPGVATEDDSVVTEVLEILKQRGIVDEQEYQRLSLKNHSYEQQQDEGFLSRIEWSGDLRLRLENFWFDRDPVEDRPNRNRGRYRLRIAGKVPINEVLKAGFRVTSGSPDDPRSTNQTFGSSDDFNNDPFNIDQAYLTFTAPRDWLGEESTFSATGGKMSNPLRWKNGKDYMLWDGDITPEGAAAKYQYRPSEPWTLYANTGYFIARENSGDPHVLALQGGTSYEASEDVELGGRLSWYDWSSLTEDFFRVAAGDGNTGFTDATGAFRSGLTDGSAKIGELAAYVRWNGLEDWPLLVYGHYAKNFEAESLFVPVTHPDPTIAGSSAGEEDAGWGIGAEIGDKKKYVKVGLGYYQLEANFTPAMFIDSDLTDGKTNRKAWTLYFSRQILRNTDVNVTLFKSDRLESGPLFAESVGGSDRYRLQTDINVKF